MWGGLVQGRVEGVGVDVDGVLAVVAAGEGNGVDGMGEMGHRL